MASITNIEIIINHANTRKIASKGSNSNLALGIGSAFGLG